jgi:pre-mRNA-splicing factor CDC5/CEF1
MRTPRDNFRLNEEDNSMQLVSQTPRDIRLREQAARSSLRGKLASLPKPKETEWELELPEDQAEVKLTAEQQAEDAAARDKRNAELAHAAALADFRKQTQVVQRGLPRPKLVDINALLKKARAIEDPVQRRIEEENALLLANDTLQFGGAKLTGSPKPLEPFNEESLQKAKMEVILEMGSSTADRTQFGIAFEREWEAAHDDTLIPGLAGYAEDEVDEVQLLTEAFDGIQNSLESTAEKGAGMEKRLGKLHGGYMARQKALRKRIEDAAKMLEETKVQAETARYAQVAEEAGMRERMESLRDEVGVVSRREREAQETYRMRREELESL